MVSAETLTATSFKMLYEHVNVVLRLTWKNGNLSFKTICRLFLLHWGFTLFCLMQRKHHRKKETHLPCVSDLFSPPFSRATNTPMCLLYFLPFHHWSSFDVISPVYSPFYFALLVSYESHFVCSLIASLVYFCSNC